MVVSAAVTVSVVVVPIVSTPLCVIPPPALTVSAPVIVIAPSTIALLSGRRR